MNILTSLIEKTPFLGQEFFGNAIWEYIVFAAVFILLMAIFAIVRGFLLRKLRKLSEKTSTDVDDTIIKIYESIRPPFYALLAFFLALRFLSIHEKLESVINAVLLIAVVYQVVRGLQVIIDYIVGRWSDSTESDSEHAVAALSGIFKGVLWVFGLLLVLSNLGIDITSLIAGLGIGGIAVALALQNILGDLFSSFALYFDKPFVPGDFIVVGGKSGTVERIGIKTTRIRSIQGEEIVMANNELTNATVQNFKQMQERRIVLNIGVTYDTPEEKLQKIPNIVKQTIDKTSKTRFDRAHFKTFGDSALIYEIVYYVDSREYTEYMDANEVIHLGLVSEFAKEKIEFAYPTQTVFHKEIK